MGQAGEAEGASNSEAASSLVAAREEHEGYAGDKSEAESSGDEHEIRASMRSILPKLASVAMPSPRSSAYSVEELIARGGTPMEAPNDDDWL